MVYYYKSQRLFMMMAMILCFMCLTLVLCGPIRKSPLKNGLGIGDEGLLNDVLPDDNNLRDGKRGHDTEDVQLQEQHPPILNAPEEADKRLDLLAEEQPDRKGVDMNFEKAIKLAGGGKLNAEQLEPVDHLDVVKMEQDGHINQEYHKEMFLGEEHEEFKSHPVDRAEGRLKEIVGKADLDQDGSLSKLEMERWVAQKMQEHFLEAETENNHIFKHLDPDGDGYIKWKEYYVHFLLSRGFSVEQALQHVQDYDESVPLNQEDKDALISYKFRWTDADTSPTDNQLSKEEFMVFRHPEHSKQSLESLVNNVMRGLDSDGDQIVTMEEFAALPPGEVENEEFRQMDLKWQAERRKEFNEIMDTDHDGKVTFSELKKYLDPTNPLQAKLEAESLLALMDDNKDELLSMDEILRHSDLFISSKVVNFAANIHEEL